MTTGTVEINNESANGAGSARSDGHRVVEVKLGERSYDIVIGRSVLGELGQRFSGLFPAARAVIITDRTVAGFHLASAEESLRAAGVEPHVIIMEPGEKTKSYAGLMAACNGVLDTRLERGDLVIALGGGVIGDLAGFVAGIIRRGMRFIQVPTTLLAQVDSSVGGKTGINTGHGKNLIGLFNQPHLVLADTAVLDTLTPRDFRAGYAEVAKYGLINQPDFFEWLEANWQGIFDGGPEREEAIARSCQAKADVVAADEHEANQRALLNLGHTFGHALEGMAEYDAERIVHGEGVAIGMVLAHEFSARLGLCDPAVTDRVVAHLQTVGLPTHIGAIPGQLPNVDLLMDFIAQDKKVSRGSLTFILTRGLGQSFVEKGVDPAFLRAFLEEKLS
ncbi:3-dehydroquinate synthase [uncultured Cohaesibacter sp.]|uniref:3-dehydroquinate synthase n=1 Tax=uncultured Cohaesibacter sp. TaxID=1002546 RepID=UPI0029C7D066|nr:3-dehydroquinate synthase [uncultured Cohaesibacter sp.]